MVNRKQQGLRLTGILEGMEKKVEFLRSEGKRTGITEYNSLADDLAEKVEKLWGKDFYYDTSTEGFASVGVNPDWITLRAPFWDQLNDKEKEITLIHELMHTDQWLISRKIFNRFDSEAEAYKEELKHILLFGTNGATTGGNTALDYLEAKWRGPGGYLFDPYLKDRSPETIKKMLRDELGIPNAIIEANFDKNFGPILGTHFPDGRPLPDMSPEARKARKDARNAGGAAAGGSAGIGAAAAGNLSGATGSSGSSGSTAGTIKVTPEQLRNAANRFKAKSQETQSMVEELRQKVSWLEGDWSGIAQQSFYQGYQEWTNVMTRFVALLQSIGLELEKVAQQIEQTDQQLANGINAQF